MTADDISILQDGSLITETNPSFLADDGQGMSAWMARSPRFGSTQSVREPATAPSSTRLLKAIGGLIQTEEICIGPLLKHVRRFMLATQAGISRV
jgi:hypothetical protein